MKYVIKYENSNESKGISDSCEKTLNKIWKDLEYDIVNLKTNELIFNIEESDFKCKKISLKYNISEGYENLCNAQTYLKESKLIDGYLTDLYVNIDIVYKKMDDEFIYYIKSVLLHELLHIFQHYNIKTKNKFRPESFSIGSIIPQLRSIVKTKYGNYILDVLYHSLSHELSAQVHQYYLHKINHRDYKRIFDIKNLIENFKIIKLNKDEEDDIIFIRKHIVGSINYLSSNKNYKNDINKSIWNVSDVYIFLDDLKKVMNYKSNWINKKINLVDKKISDSNIINYDENHTLPHDWIMYDLHQRNIFIKENLSDSSNIEFI